MAHTSVRTFTIFLCSISVGLTQSLPVSAQAGQLRPNTAAVASTPSRDAANPPTVAVIAFQNITGAEEDAWIGFGIAETVTSDLAGLGTIQVTGNNTVQTALAQAVSDSSSEVTDTPTVRAGRALGARWVVEGGFQRLGNRLRLTARILDMETTTVEHAVTVDGLLSEFFDLQDRLSEELRQGFPMVTVPAQNRLAGDAVPPVPPSLPDDDRPGVSRTLEAPGGSPPGEGEPPRFRRPSTPSAMIDGPPPPEPPDTFVRDATGRITVRATPVPQGLDIDGLLDEGIYEVTQPLTGFLQQQPNEGAPATESTEAWVFYDDSNVYVSARLYDSAPESQWVANEMQRDSFQLVNNDSFSVAFDTFYDRRNGFSFLVNPIGGFFDYQITDEGNPNSDWNPIWRVRTGRFPGGWTVEMAIPFKSIRFPGGEDQIWGIQLGRNIRWKNEWDYLTPVAISAGPGMFRLSAAGTLTGLEVPSGNRTFEIKPYAIGSVATDINSVPVVNNKGDGDFGVDVKYGITENLTADFTYNTDFAQVEVDEQQVNLTRFSLFFPEKREFFLEGRGIFDFGRGVQFGGGGGPGGGGRPSAGGFFGGGNAPTVFFSRRIGLESGQTVPILAGGRLTGKVGDVALGALNIQTDDVSGGEAKPTNFTALRIKRDILRRSSVGAIFTGRSVSLVGDGANQAFGVDGAFSFYDNVNFNGFYSKTQTPGLIGDDESYQAAFTYNGDLYALGVDHILVGENFNPEMGFLRRDDFRRTFAQARYSPRPRSIAAVRQFIWGGSIDYFENVPGQVVTRLAQANFQTVFENSDRFSADLQESYEFLFRPFQVAEDVTIPVGGYPFRDSYLSYSMGAQRRLSGTVFFQSGGFFNGDITAFGYSRGRIEVTPQFSFEPSISINRIELPAGTFTARLATSRFTYTFTPRMFFSGLMQYNSTAGALSTNLRLRWEYRPGSELFVVYNDQRDTALTPGRFPMLENRAFVVKFTRLFRF